MLTEMYKDGKGRDRKGSGRVGRGMLIEGGVDRSTRGGKEVGGLPGVNLDGDDGCVRSHPV